MEIKGGIDRNANNRSSMLWQVERILLERLKKKKTMPRFLLMENVRNITSYQHSDNFKEWQKSLEKMGYINQVLKLDASEFGIPQKRVRIYMISIYVEKDSNLKKQIERYFDDHSLEKSSYISTLNIKNKKIKELIKTDYTKNKYKEEADFNQPNNTKSRKSIYDKNCHLYDGKKFLESIVSTITTKQDRHPNSGVIEYDSGIKGKAEFRYLTPRECFLLMGFDEKDYEIIIDNNFNSKANTSFFTRDKLHKMAGNSIVVSVLEQIFKQIDYINRNIFKDNS